MEEKEFIATIKEHRKIMYKVCNLYAYNNADKEDLLQEMILNAWKGVRNFKGDAKFSTWLYRVALNTALTYTRKAMRAKETILTGEWQDDLLQHQPFEANEQLTAMYRAIAMLSDIDKALVMLYLDDYSYQEMSVVIGITPNNIAVKMNRIKKKLKEESEKIYNNY